MTENTKAVECRELPADEFNGDNAHLIDCIVALIYMSDAGAMVPHGIGGHARTLLAAAARRLAAQPAVPEGAVWLMPVATDTPQNPKLQQYAWGRSNLSTGQMAHAYDCIVSAAQDCGQFVALTTPQPDTAQGARGAVATMGVSESGSIGFASTEAARNLAPGRYSLFTTPTGDQPDTAQGAGGAVDGFDFLAHLFRQREWSERTFGPGARTAGVVDHIRKELCEIEADPADTSEWIDVAILALDGAWRAGASPQEIISALVAKQTKNEGRVWPDWRTMPADKAIEHDRSYDTTPTGDQNARAVFWMQPGLDRNCHAIAGAWGDVHRVMLATKPYDSFTVPLYTTPPAPVAQVGDGARAALLYALYHHQGGSSPVGQTARHALGIGRFDRLTTEQIAEGVDYARTAALARTQENGW